MTVSVENIELIETLPKINRKTNGFNYGPILKGSFILDEFGQCELFLESKEGPFIYVKTGNGAPIIINTESIKETKELSMRLVAEFKK